MTKEQAIHNGFHLTSESALSKREAKEKLEKILAKGKMAVIVYDPYIPGYSIYATIAYWFPVSVQN